MNNADLPCVIVFSRRDLSEVLARDDGEESGALNIDKALHVAETVIPPAYQAGKQLWDEQCVLVPC